MRKSRGSSTSTASKRSTGRRAAATGPGQTKKQIAFGRRQARQNRIIWLSIAVLALLIFSVLTVGLVSELILKPGTAVATVNGQKIRLDDYQALLRLYRFNVHQGLDELAYNLQLFDSTDPETEQLLSLLQSQMSLYEADLVALPDTTLEQLIQDQLIEQKASEIGIRVSAAEIERSIDSSLTPTSPTQPITGTESLATPTPIPQKDLDTAYRALLDAVGIRNRKYRAIIGRNLLRAGVQDRLAEDVATTGLVVHVQQIRTDAEETANQAMQRLEQGEDFAAVAREVSNDPQVEDTGGDLGWIAPGQKVAEYGEEWDTLILSLDVGKLAQLESSGSFYVVHVLERLEDGALPEEVVLSRQAAALDDWLDQQMGSPEVTIVRLLEAHHIPEDPFLAP